jgi:hypothetical protein
MPFCLLHRASGDWQFHEDVVVDDERTAIATCIEKHQTHPNEGFGYMEVA